MCALVPAGGLVAINKETLEPIATEMARIYHESIASIERHMDGITEACQLINDTFYGDDETKSGWDFAIGFSFKGERYGQERSRIFDDMKRTAWEVLANRIGIRNIMSMAKRREFDKQLQSGELPEITPDAIMSVIMGLIQQSQDFATEAVREAFEFLRNRRGDYKTNLKYRVGKRVIIEYAVYQGYRGFTPQHHKDDFFRALDGVMLVLDGKTPLREGRTAISEAIYGAVDGKAETEYFKLKMFKKGTLHLEFKRRDLLIELNRIATGSAEIGADE